MTSTNIETRLKAVLEEVDLPERAYAQAERRYEDLTGWISRPESKIAKYDAHIFVQGSFALGTPIRPVNVDEEYDLDFSCALRTGISRNLNTQKDLKQLVGGELADYRHARNIHKRLEEKNRCWRLGYKDELPFHMDVVPGIPADDVKRTELRTLMEATGIGSALARELASRSLWITDIQRQNYASISSDWPSSNPEGYQLWFRSLMQPKSTHLLMEAAKVDALPVYRSKAPLQQAVQILKRHRDVMFKDDPDAKPASIILTTVAGNAYVHGESLSQTLERTVAALERIRLSDADEILNPVNPKENFADRWARRDCAHLSLKSNFHRWIKEVFRTTRWMLDDSPGQAMLEVVERHLDIEFSEASRRAMGVVGSSTPATSRSVVSEQNPPRPWAT